MSTDEGKHPKGYWMGIGISTGVAIGVALGSALENMGAGIAIGIAIGAGIGESLEQKNKDKIRPLTEREKRLQKWGVILGLVILVIFAVALILLLFLSAR
jgi:F0F1-type ATP synthase membrane subunit c/vacuolar-type H+-ATPase subunit K